MSVKVRPVELDDHVEWARLYAGYAEFYGVEQTVPMRAKVWDWLMTPDHEVDGLVAEWAGQVIGIAHYRPFARPLAAGMGGFLDDLYVDPAARGAGAADALLAAVKAVGATRGWGVIRWITAEDNARARRVYDRTAVSTRWVTYDLTV